MGLIGVLIAAVIIIFLAFSHFSKPTSITPKNATELQNNAQDVVNSVSERDKLEQNQINNIDLP